MEFAPFIRGETYQAQPVVKYFTQWFSDYEAILRWPFSDEDLRRWVEENFYFQLSDIESLEDGSKICHGKIEDNSTMIHYRNLIISHVGEYARVLIPAEPEPEPEVLPICMFVKEVPGWAEVSRIGAELKHLKLFHSDFEVLKNLCEAMFFFKLKDVEVGEDGSRVCNGFFHANLDRLLNDPCFKTFYKPNFGKRAKIVIPAMPIKSNEKSEN